MAFLEWDDSYSVGIHCIDEQHTALFDMMNQFYDNINIESNKNNIAKLIANMRGYTLMHFVDEEDYMVEFEYPELESHRLEHEFFLSKVANLEERLNKGDLILSFEITNFIKEWLTNHIKDTDQKYSDFFRERGLE